MLPPNAPDRRKEDKELMAILAQIRNAGFDMGTVEGQNRLRKSLEFSDRNRRRCETATGELTKYGILAVAMTVTALLATQRPHIL